MDLYKTERLHNNVHGGTSKQTSYTFAGPIIKTFTYSSPPSSTLPVFITSNPNFSYLGFPAILACTYTPFPASSACAMPQFIIAVKMPWAKDR